MREEKSLCLGKEFFFFFFSLLGMGHIYTPKKYETLIIKRTKKKKKKNSVSSSLMDAKPKILDYLIHIYEEIPFLNKK